MVNDKSYIINGELQNLESLYPAATREKEISELLSFVKSGKSAQLIAMPGVGRGNLLGFLAYNRTIRIHHLGEAGQMQYHFVLVNFSEMRNRPLFDVMKFLFLELSSSLHERNREEEFLIVDGLFKEALSYADSLVLFQGLKKAIDYLALERHLTITFLFERFETYIPAVTDTFFNNLRSIRNRAKYQFSVIFSTTRPLEDILDPEILADFYEFVADNHVYLSLQDTVGLQFRISYLEKLTGRKLGQKTINNILALTSGHGKLTRLAMEIVLAHPVIPAQAGIDKNNDLWIPGQARDDTLEQTLLSQKTIRGALMEIWQFLTPDEQQDMLTLCKGELCPIPNPFLQHIDLITDKKITIPLFASFVKSEALTGRKQSYFSLDIATNTIRRNDIVISDSLTSSEFRLLRLLIEHENTVLDREGIISAVWSDSKTQEGVSDQAIDQLTFRLRKKIEEDPTAPTHIITVKGRGVKFVQ